MRLPFFQFVRASKMPTPGAMEYGYESEMLAFRPMIGPAIAARVGFLSIRAPSNPQMYQANTTNWFVGLGGLAQGQVVLQPLSNPWQSQGLS
jgi:hypothetical protein